VSTTAWPPDTGAAFQYIQNLLNYLNSNYSEPNGTDPFTLFPGQSGALTGDSSVTPTTPDPSNPTNPPFTNYNFAVARVRLKGAAGTSTGEAYAHNLIDAGVPVTAVRYFGTTHDFVMLSALANTPAARGAVDQASEALKKALSD
jgi:acetyl esterase/lipase